MGTLTCRCGHYIKTANEGTERYSADFLPEKSWGKLSDEILRNLYAVVEATKQGQTAAQWANVVMSNKEGEEGLLLHYFYQEAFLSFSRSMYQCEVCQRIYLETGKRNAFRSFAPESDDSQAILDSENYPVESD
jgi:hypothetical protein